MQQPNVKLLNNRVLVKPDPEENTSEGGIALISAQRSNALSGTVVAIGPGKLTPSGTLLPMTVKVGDNVLYESGSVLKIDGEEFVLLPEHDLLLILLPKDEQVV